MAQMTPVPWLPTILAGLLGFLVFFNSLDGEFVYDDQTYVIRNSSVSGEDGVLDEATPPHRKDLGLYRPVTVLTYRWNRDLSGLDPFAFHLTNALLHALVCSLIVFLATRFGASVAAALMAGCLFATHPVHVEAVAWVVGRAEILSAIFSLLAIITFGSPGARRSTMRTLVAALFYGIACISKETALPLPLLLFLLDTFDRSTPTFRSRAIRLLPFAVVCFAIVVIRFSILGQFGPDVSIVPELGGLSFGERVALGLRSFMWAIWHLCVPTSLSIYYDPRHFQSVAAVLLGAAFGIGTLITIWRVHKKGNIAAFRGLLLFLVAMIPFLHIVPIGAFFADRFLYLPSAGFLIAFSAVILPAGNRPNSARVLIAAALVIICTALTITRNTVFQSNFALWQDAAVKDPTAALPTFQLGYYYNDAGLLDYQSDTRRGALYHWAESLKLDPEHPFAVEANLRLGEHAAGKERDAKRASHFYREALRLDATCVPALLDLAALHRTNEVSGDEARLLLKQVLAVSNDPTERAHAENMLTEIEGP